MIDISAIIVNWNTKRLLMDCIHSIINETKEYKIEIIVVDNCSADGSPEEVKQKFPEVKLIVNDRNLGFSKANNIGIRKSTGKYICLVNSDIKVLAGCLDRMCGYMDKHPAIGMLGPKAYNKDFVLQHTCREFPTLWSLMCQASFLTNLFPASKLFKDSFMTYFDHNTVRRIEALSGCFLMVRRTALDEVGLLDEKFFIYAEDVDWCKRFYKAGWDIVFYPEAEIIHYGSASSSAAPVRFILEMLKANFQYWEKYHGRVSQFLHILINIYHSLIRIKVLFVSSLISKAIRGKYKLKLNEHVARLKWIVTNKIYKKSLLLE